MLMLSKVSLEQWNRDPVCGYVGVINDVCPGCGRKEFEGVPMEKITAPECCGR